jgi:hypothetical protein
MTKSSAYATTKDVINGKYPVKECLNSVSNIVDEVIVFDTSRKNDGTREMLKALSSANKKIKIYTDDSIPWDAPNHGIYDGICKTKARLLCSGDVLFQVDVDEVIHEKDYVKWQNTIAEFADSPADILAFPVIEFWGANKIRIDIGPIKERLTKNKTMIIHGIPGALRYQKDGLMYAKPGTDGCNLISPQSLQPLPMHVVNVDFMSTLRQQALWNEDANETYSSWFLKNIINHSTIPSIYHYSWFSIKRKLETYRSFWSKSWAALYGDDPTYNNPMFPGLKNEDVTDEMINQYSSKIENLTAGWIFHKPWDGTIVYGIDITSVSEVHPTIMNQWVADNK